MGNLVQVEESGVDAFPDREFSNAQLQLWLWTVAPSALVYAGTGNAAVLVGGLCSVALSIALTERHLPHLLAATVGAWIYGQSLLLAILAIFPLYALLFGATVCATESSFLLRDAVEKVKGADS